jgi:hypothetical protein
MREPHRRSLARLLFPLLLGTCIALGLPGQRNTTHADAPSISFSVLNGRTGLLHVTATGLPTRTVVWLVLVTQTLANPPQVAQYIKVTTSDDGTIDMDDPTGEFICGTRVQVVAKALQPPQVAAIPGPWQQILVIGSTDAESAIVLAHCPATNPIIGITTVTNGVAQVSGQGFYLKETVGITITSTLTGFVTGVTTLTDDQGDLAAAVPLGAITCPDTLTPHAAGLAGSIATGAPFSYVCGDPPPVVLATATAAPTAKAAPAEAVPPVAGEAHLTLTTSPPSIRPHQLETIRVAAGLPNVVLRAVFTAAGIQPAAFSVRADRQGNARFTYMAPARVPSGHHLVRVTISYRVGSRTISQTGSFTIVGP